MRAVWIVLAAVMTLLASWRPGAAAPADAVASVQIEYEHMGLLGRSKEAFTITRDGAGFVRHGATTGTEAPDFQETQKKIEPAQINAALIQALYDAAVAPRVSRSQFFDELTKPEWLRANAAAAYKTVARSTCSDEARRLFITAFESPASARKALARHFEGFHTDDYPSAKLVLTTQRGKTVELSSPSQHAFMLPWFRGKTEHWNAAISRALGDVLPQDSALRERLAADDYLLRELSDEVLSPIRDRWEDLELRCEHRDVIAALAPKYRVVGVYGNAGDTFTGYLQSDDMPSNLALNVVLDVSAPAREKVLNELFERGPKYIGLARNFVLAQPKARFTVWYKEGRSFEMDHVDVTGDPKFEDLRPIADSCALIREHDYWNGRHWVALPSGEVRVLRERPYASRRPSGSW